MCGLSLTPLALPEKHLYDTPAALSARLLARLIDYTLIAIMACLSDWMSGGAFYEGLNLLSEGIDGLPQVKYAIVLELILIIGYFIIFHSLNGQTPGKYICGIIVLRKGQDVPNLFANLLREIGIWISILTGGWLFLIHLFSPGKRGFHDFMGMASVYRMDDMQS